MKVVSHKPNKAIWSNDTDLGSYAKLANGLIFSGNIKEANLVIDYCLRNFFDPKTGDFLTDIKTNKKSQNMVFKVFYPYTNQWLLQAGLNLRRYDYVFKAAKFMEKFYNPVLNLSTIIAPYNENGGNVHCLFNSAALGTYIHILIMYMYDYIYVYINMKYNI